MPEQDACCQRGGVLRSVHSIEPKTPSSVLVAHFASKLAERLLGQLIRRVRLRLEARLSIALFGQMK